MTPLKQQISLIPFSIEHTGISLTSDGVLKIGETFCILLFTDVFFSVLESANQTSASAKILNKSDMGFVFGFSD